MSIQVLALVVIVISSKSRREKISTRDWIGTLSQVLFNIKQWYLTESFITCRKCCHMVTNLSVKHLSLIEIGTWDGDFNDDYMERLGLVFSVMVIVWYPGGLWLEPWTHRSDLRKIDIWVERIRLEYHALNWSLILSLSNWIDTREWTLVDGASALSRFWGLPTFLYHPALQQTTD